jgi:hypothetical protein
VLQTFVPYSRACHARLYEIISPRQSAAAGNSTHAGPSRCMHRYIANMLCIFNAALEADC